MSRIEYSNCDGCDAEVACHKMSSPALGEATMCGTCARCDDPETCISCENEGIVGDCDHEEYDVEDVEVYGNYGSMATSPYVTRQLATCTVCGAETTDWVRDGDEDGEWLVPDWR